MGAILEEQSTRLQHKRHAVKKLHASLAMDPDTFHPHAAGIVHRASSPGTFSCADGLERDGFVEVLDFGVSKMRRAADVKRYGPASGIVVLVAQSLGGGGRFVPVVPGATRIAP